MKTMDELVTWFQLKYPKLVSAMKSSNRHYDETNLNPFHLESDCFTHTMMTCLQARHSPPVVQMAALLHDIGKPFTRWVKESNKHVYFTNHESMSAFLALDILKEVDWLDEEEKIQVFRAIAHHTDVFKLTETQLNDVFTNEPTLSYIVKELAICDHLGRFTSIPTELVDFTYNSKDPRPPRDKDVYILVGLPACGKSTRANELANDGAFVVSSDDIVESMYPNLSYNAAFEKIDKVELDRLFKERIKESKNHSKVVIDTTNLSKKRRKFLIDTYKKEYNIHCEVFLVPMNELLRRNEERAKNGKFIPENVYYDMVKRFYPPSVSEGIDYLEYKLL